MRRPSSPLPEQDKTLTSMIDVVFLLLIFFVCSMNFRVIEGRLNTELPKGGGQAELLVSQALEPLELRVDLDHEQPAGFAVRAWGRPVPIERLSALVAAVLAEVPETTARLFTGEGVTQGHVVAVIDALCAGGMSTVSFAG